MYRIPGRPRLHDRVVFPYYSDTLVSYTCTGKVIECDGGASIVEVDTPKGNGIPDRVVVPHAIASVYLEESELTDNLIDTLKLIAGQDQGCGGNVTEAEIGRNCLRIAREKLAMLGVR